MSRRLARRGFCRSLAQIRSKVKVLQNAFYRARPPALGEARGRLEERAARPEGGPPHQEEEELPIPAGREEEQFPPMEGQEAAIEAEEEEEEQEEELARPVGREEEDIPPMEGQQAAIEEEEEPDLELADFPPPQPEGEGEPPLRDLIAALSHGQEELIRRMGDLERRMESLEMWVRHFWVAGSPPR
ncbi:hypothetical protein JD844_008855 [Phrynosoma platyrhinos]|uniref:Uncharacterized protein n=1 Tax=Phrynosoma platyrhinos TaxID=52577 RepID=A0ABQ7TF85_PHRPL|nr:hypothetical protein JD844_008855 [Phrynosoma platyrhinos]